MSEWIKCSERLPEDREEVLIWTTDCQWAAFRTEVDINPYGINVGWRNKGNWYGSNLDYDGCSGPAYNVTHWMPLPDPPETELEGRE